jgi:hypothetical protein
MAAADNHSEWIEKQLRVAPALSPEQVRELQAILHASNSQQTEHRIESAPAERDAA